MAYKKILLCVVFTGAISGVSPLSVSNPLPLAPLMASASLTSLGSLGSLGCLGLVFTNSFNTNKESQQQNGEGIDENINSTSNDALVTDDKSKKHNDYNRFKFSKTGTLKTQVKQKGENGSWFSKWWYAHEHYMLLDEKSIDKNTQTETNSRLGRANIVDGYSEFKISVHSSNKSIKNAIISAQKPLGSSLTDLFYHRYNYQTESGDNGTISTGFMDRFSDKNTFDIKQNGKSIGSISHDKRTGDYRVYESEDFNPIMSFDSKNQTLVKSRDSAGVDHKVLAILPITMYYVQKSYVE